MHAIAVELAWRFSAERLTVQLPLWRLNDSFT